MAQVNIDKIVPAIILDDSTIAGIIGTRLTPMIITDDTSFPAMTYQRISSPEHHDIDFAYPRYQFNSYAETYGAVVELAIAVKELWQRYKGVFNSVKIKQGVYIDETQPDRGKDGLWTIQTDIKIIYYKIT